MTSSKNRASHFQLHRSANSCLSFNIQYPVGQI